MALESKLHPRFRATVQLLSAVLAISFTASALEINVTSG